MKKLMILIFILLPLHAFATDICARDDTMVLILDKKAPTTGQTFSSTSWTWTISHSFGTIAGETSCLSITEGLGRTTGKGEFYGTNDYSTTFITASPGMHGTDSDGNERIHCWCRITHPLISHWTYSSSYKNATDCKNNCPGARSCPWNGAYLNSFDSIGL